MSRLAPLGAGLLACGGLQTPPAGEPDPDVLVPRLFDPTDLYREMGFLANAEPVPFVASVHFLAGPSPDTVFAVVGASLASNALSFRKAGSWFEARYLAEVVFEREGRALERVSANEVVRVASFAETLRADESIIFQQIGRVPPGSLTVHVSLRDVYGDQGARDRRAVVVPRFPPGVLGGPVPVYQARGRATTAEVPRLLVNPRATAPFGLDSLTFYLEAYGAGVDSLALLALTPEGTVFWRRTAVPGDTGGVRAVRITIPPEDLPVGRLAAAATANGDTVRIQALVSFSDQWTITNFEDVLSLLRYFGHQEALDSMRRAAPEERARQWRAFWRMTDPNPVTPQNETLERYFRRVQTANSRYQEAGEQGWLTDRGEVFITLGDPDEVFDQRAGVFESTRRVIRWVYVPERLTLDFVDESGFGRYRMTPLARSEFERAATRRRQREER